jgi:hypothetical protein
MREKINEHFIASLHNVKAGEVDLLEQDGEIKHGDNVEYIELREFIASNSMAVDENYEYVTDRIDEINFIQYQVAEIYYNNGDWPGNNIDYWKAGDGKWRWILFDTDFGLGVFDPNGYKYNSLAFATDPYGPAWPNPPWSTLFLRKLLENEQFRRKFVNYFADAMNSVFLPGSAVTHVAVMAAGIEGEIFRHRQRWGQSVSSWQTSVNRMKTFFTGRPGVARNFIMDEFDLPAVHEISIYNDQPAQGSVRVNSLVIESPYWSGKYFQDNPISLTAFPKPGYKFDHWSGDVNSSEPMVFINLAQASSVTAHFVTAGSINQPVVINEINYNSPDNPDPSDWIELFNYSEAAVELSGWIFSDGDSTHAFVIPDSTLLEAGGFLVLCRDITDFTQVYPDVEHVLGGFEFGLSSAGDAVCLYDLAGALLDSVHYLPSAPWPEEANGMGPTLELISPDLDNVLPESWHAFQGYGTPGALNHYISGIKKVAAGDRLRIFPNPARDLLNLVLDAPNLTFASIRFIDQKGVILKDSKVSPGLSAMTADVSSLRTGQYLVLVVLSDGSMISVKMQKI